MDDFFKIKVSEVLVDDSARQRQTLNLIEDLAESITRIGQLNPIILDEKNNLIAGRRRLEAVRSLGYETILARRLDTLDAFEKKLIELDENLRRVDLTWQENALAVLELHELKQSVSPTWSQYDTGEYLGASNSYVSNAVLVGQALRQDDKKVAASSSVAAAADLLRRRRVLALEAAMDQEFGEPELKKDDLGQDFGILPQENHIYDSQQISPDQPPTPAGGARPVKYHITIGDFLSLLKGKQFSKFFNLIHCDFPYGINFDQSDQGGSRAEDSQYGDSKEIFWGLTRALLKHQEEFIAPSAHMIFWYSMNYHSELVALLEDFGWFVVPTPLIWHKSCNSGIAADYRRRPKHIYETALFCSRGDRQLLTLKNDLFSAPLARNKESHISAKPQEMLEYFLSMVVTEYTTFLDPTCGSGTSVRAAAKLGAESALGIELNPETAEAAIIKLSLYLKSSEHLFVPKS